MALAISNKTSNIGTPSALTQTFNHSASSPNTDRYVFVFIAMSNAVDFAGVTYGGAAMTQVGVVTTASTLTRWAIYSITGVSTGSNPVEITFTAAQYNPVSSFAITVNGSAGVGNIVFDDTATSPNSTSITISANSIIVGGEVSGVSTGNVITLDGSIRPLEHTHNINNWTSVAVSLTGLTSGSKAVSVASGADVAGYYFEIKETGAAPPVNNAGLLLMF